MTDTHDEEGDSEQDVPRIDRASLEDVRVAVGVLMVHNELVSIGRGAELAGLPHKEFHEMIDRYDANWATGPQSIEELEDDQ